MVNFGANTYLNKLRRKPVTEKDAVNGAANGNGVVGNGYHGGDYDQYSHEKLPWLTWRGFFMGVLVSMGGMLSQTRQGPGEILTTSKDSSSATTLDRFPDSWA